MIEMDEAVKDVSAALEQSTRGKKRGRKPKKAASTEPHQPPRIGIELPDAITAEIAEYLAAHPLVSPSGLKNIIREAARKAALEAVSGKVADIARASV